MATRQMIPAKNVMIDWGSHARHSVDQGLQATRSALPLTPLV